MILLNKIKICVQYYSHRNKAIDGILKADPEATIKIKNQWDFKVLTKLTPTQICEKLVDCFAHEDCFTVKKTLFF